MNKEELSKEIQQHEQKMSSLTSQMDNLYREIQAAMPTAAAAWITKEVERRIKDNPEVVQSLGIEKLKEFKFKLKALTETMPEIVAAEFQNSGIWPHHKVIPSSNYNQNESHLNRVFRNVISYLGSLLDEFGLIERPKGHIPSWERTGQKRFRYAINPGLDYLPETKIKDYWILFDEYTSVSQKIKDIQKSLAETKAIELWNNA